MQLLAIGNLDDISLLCVCLPVVQDLDILVYESITLAGEFNILTSLTKGYHKERVLVHASFHSPLTEKK